jgi:hypothetical protein
MELPKEQKGNNSSENSVIVDNDQIRHLIEYFTFSFFDGDEMILDSNAENDFLVKLDKYVEKNPKSIKYIHRNLPNVGVYYTYLHSEEGVYKKSYPDFILKTTKGTPIICEIKSEQGDRDEDKTRSIENGYLENSKEIGNYFFGIIKDSNKKFKLCYCVNGKKIDKDIDFRKKYENEITEFVDLDVLFEIIFE